MSLESAVMVVVFLDILSESEFYFSEPEFEAFDRVTFIGV